MDKRNLRLFLSRYGSNIEYDGFVTVIIDYYLIKDELYSEFDNEREHS